VSVELGMSVPVEEEVDIGQLDDVTQVAARRPVHFKPQAMSLQIPFVIYIEFPFLNLLQIVNTLILAGFLRKTGRYAGIPPFHYLLIGAIIKDVLPSSLVHDAQSVG